MSGARKHHLTDAFAEPPQVVHSRSLSITSDDEYNYSDLEDDYQDEEEVEYIDDDDDDSASVGSNTSHGRRRAGSDLEGKAHANARLSPVGANGSANKKKRVSSALSHSNMKAAADYRVIDEEELLQELRALIHEIASVLENSPAVSAILLRHYGWNKEKLFEGYYLDPVKARQDAGVELADVAPPELTENQEHDCHICCDAYPSNEMYSMGCGHLYCVNCWKSYLSVKITEGPICIMTTCPAHGCKEAVTDAIFRKLLPEDEFKRYWRFVLRSYVDINKGVKWCPAAGCNKAISSAGGGLSSVRCTCGNVFCLRCGEESHSPVTCEQLALWQEKCKNESETANWILANTKKCPKCSVRIEKNQGCNHMTCRKCHFEFCWICMQDWTKHGSGTGGYYKCNRYEAQAADQDTDAARAKAELDRYLHYYQRYANHSEAGKFAHRMREGTEARMIELQATHGDSSWIDVQFLNAATEQLIECRRVLKYTYVFGYYLQAGKEKNLFEYLQEDLEKNTEHLTGLSEMPLDKMNRADIVNYTRVTETFLKNLLTGVEDGLTSGGPTLLDL